MSRREHRPERRHKAELIPSRSPPQTLWRAARTALRADAERGRHSVWKSFDHSDFFPGLGILLATLAHEDAHLQCIPVEPISYYPRRAKPIQTPKPNQKPRHPPEQGYTHTSPPRNHQHDKLLLQEAVRRGVVLADRWAVHMFELACIIFRRALQAFGKDC